MKVLIGTDAHIFRTPDGNYWCKSIYGYDFWKRYLDTFEQVKIVARVKEIEKIEEKYILVNGPSVEVFGIPFFQGPFELLKKYLSINKKLKNVEEDCDVAIFRMPSQTAYMIYSKMKKKMPIAGEIVYDPYDDLKNKQNLFAFILNKIISYRLKKFCLNANGVSYVTSSVIQSHYPSRSIKNRCITDKYFDTYYSSINLQNDAYTGARNYDFKKTICMALSSVSMNSDRKGEKVLINIVKKVRDKGYDVTAVLIGDGTKRKEFEEFAKELNVEKYVKFTGMLASAEEVRNVLINSDIFVFPTQAEGLPRGILEAMAVGMPVLSTPVGGIPEIIDKENLFLPDDIDGFSNRICYLLENRKELNKMSNENFTKSKEFNNDILQKRRNDFYNKLIALAK